MLKQFSNETGILGALLMGADGAFITGSDILMDGGVTATYWFGSSAASLHRICVHPCPSVVRKHFPFGVRGVSCYFQGDAGRPSHRIEPARC